MPIEVSRFGVGHRRPVGAPWTEGVSGRVIHSDARGVVTELAFSRGSRIAAHANPNTTYLVVIEGGGWTAVGDERIRIAAGEAVTWPADIDHAAWTEGTEMRAIAIEFSGADDAAARGVLLGAAQRLGPGETGQAPRGEGRLVPPRRSPEDVDRSAGEPL